MSNRIYFLLALVAITVLTTLSRFADAEDPQEENKIPDQVRVILEQAEQFELLSLDPSKFERQERGEQPKNGVYGRGLLGSTIVKDAEVRERLITAFEKGVEENDGNTAFCFAPRHAIRATLDGKTATFLICFECLQVKSFLDGKPAGNFLITASPAPVFNKVLTDAQVPLAVPPKPRTHTFPNYLLVILEKAEQFELLSLDPAQAVPKPDFGFHGWEVLGKTEVDDPDVRKELVAAFDGGVSYFEGSAAECFLPRHGIRATYDGRTAEFVISFECFRVESYLNDKQDVKFLTAESSAALFNKILTDAQVPLPAKPKKE